MLPRFTRSILVIAAVGLLTLTLGGCVYYPGYGPGFYGPAVFGGGYSRGSDGGGEDR